MVTKVEKIICTPGCLCCACVCRNENINKKFNDEVMCYQEDEKCVKIVNLDYELVEDCDD